MSLLQEMGLSVREKVRAGEYNTKLPYPARPHEPAFLRKAARDLTPDEIAYLGQAKAEYAAAIEAERAARTKYSVDSGRLLDILKADLEAEYGLKGHPKANVLWEKAYEKGHSGGMEEVVCVYEDLVDLIK